jgi:hypothetical protein
MLQRVVNAIRSLSADGELTAAAKGERRRDREGPRSDDPGVDNVIELNMAWLARAQDCSLSADGGVARDYSLLRGWSSSYPETTGYIIPTFLEHARLSGDGELRQRAKRMLEWLVSIQLPVGAFQGGRIDSAPVVPVTFNTGQILLGLVAGEKEFGGYREAVRRAADWLVATQDSDGCWRRHPSPFAQPGEKAYDTHVAWSLLEAERVEPGRGYAEAALANVRWAVGKQLANGWIRDCDLASEARPITHTLGYALRGILEAYEFSSEAQLLSAARRTGDALLSALEPEGRLPGQFDEEWRPTADWVCLTGSAQVAYCWLVLYRCTGERRYRDGAFAANRFVRRTVSIDGPADTRGGVKGSFPVDGAYGEYQYLNWATKFCADAQTLEREIRQQ